MIGVRLRELRNARNIDQTSLAKEMGVSKQTISNWEHDHIDPTIQMVVRLARYFGVTTDYLLGVSQENALCTHDLTDREIAHIQAVIQDLCEHRSK